jgi:hypothetical protein
MVKNCVLGMLIVSQLIKKAFTLISLITHFILVTLSVMCK